jgi:rRNA maturation endonuclease Nob1
MRSRRVLLLPVALFITSCGGPEPPPFKPVVDTKLLMQSVIDPNADIVWEAVKTIDTPKGIEEIRPKTDEEWAAVRNAAVTVAESGNLLMMVPRAKDGGDWMKLAQQMIDTGQEAIKAAEAKNAERLFTVGGDIYDSCSACHRQYMDAIVNANK